MKAILYKECETHLKGRLQRIQKTIADLQDSLTSETKSTAGDKHETGRAMVQLEREKAGVQLAEIQKLEKILCKIDIQTNVGLVRLGSVVFTSDANYFLAISAGLIKIKDTSFYAIATNTPIGKLLVGKQVGETYTFNNKTITILNVL